MELGAVAPADSRAVAEAPTESLAPVVVPGVDVVSITNLGEGTSPGGVHVIQRLSGGATLDVYHLPAGVDPAVLAPLESDRNEVRAEREEGWVVLRAALDETSLLELLARLVPPR
jgi:hypothetical protein